MGLLDNQQPTMENIQQQQYLEAMQQQVPQQYGNVYNPMPPQLSPDVIRYRLESDDLLDNLRHDLKGEEWIDSKWVPMYGRWINEQGLSTILSIASRYVNRGSYLANLTTDQINFKCHSLRIELARLVFKKYKLYEIDPAKRKLLIRKILDNIHLSLSRSENAFESQELGKTTSNQHIIHEDKTPQNNFGIMSMLPWNRNK